ncbi:MAG: hypothetical protein FWD71_08970 [Oscillospiraceae bacterium]|nr:hypothetical protein [Oscillospiraceae bacterium]
MNLTLSQEIITIILNKTAQITINKIGDFSPDKSNNNGEVIIGISQPRIGQV